MSLITLIKCRGPLLADSDTYSYNKIDQQSISRTGLSGDKEVDRRQAGRWYRGGNALRSETCSQFVL
jgi:hypothetical protein